MTPKSRFNTLKLAGGALSLAALIMSQASAATITKASSGTVLNVGSAWVGGNVPTGSDVGYFDSTSVPVATSSTAVTTTFTLGGNVTVGQLALFIQPTLGDTSLVIDPGVPGSILTLNGVNGIGLNNLSFQPPGSGNKNAILQLGSGTTVNVANSQIWQAVNRQINVNGVITGTSGTTLTKIGNGSLTIGGGAATINTFAGNLVMGGNGVSVINSSFSTLSNLTVAGGTTLLNLNQTLPNTVLINGSSTLTGAGGNLTLVGKTSGAVSQSFASTSLGEGGTQFTLNNNNNAAGTTLNLGAITRTAGGTFNFNTVGTGTSTLTTTTGTASTILKTSTGIAYGTVGSGTAITWASKDATNTNVVGFPVASLSSPTVAGTLSSADNGLDVNFTGSTTSNITTAALGTLRLADGATVNPTLTITTGNTLSTGGILAANSTSTYNITGGTLTALAGSQELVILNAGTQTLGITSTIADNAGGAVSVTYGGTGQINVVTAGTYTGETYVGGGSGASVAGGTATTGILRMNSATSGNANSTYHVSGSSILNVNNQNGITLGGLTGYGSVTLGTGKVSIGSNNASTTFDGVFTSTSTAATITKVGTGTLRTTGFSLTNTNNYTGSLAVNAGTLLVNGSFGNASGTAIANGATLGGIGTVSSITTVSGSKIAPGDSTISGGIGTLTGTTLALTSGTHFVFDLSASSTASDVLALTGALTGDSGTYAFDFSGGQVGNTYTLLTYSSATGIGTGTTTSFTSNGGYVGTFTNTGTSLTFTYTAVPEPTTWGLMGVGLGLLAIVKRRQRQS